MRKVILILTIFVFSSVSVFAVSPTDAQNKLFGGAAKYQSHIEYTYPVKKRIEGLDFLGEVWNNDHSKEAVKSPYTRVRRGFGGIADLYSLTTKFKEQDGKIYYTIYLDKRNEPFLEKKLKKRDAEVKKIVNKYKKKSKYKRTKAIYTWITRNVKYDNSLTRRSSYNAIIDKRATCAGYAHLMCLMCEEAGIPARYVDGTAGGGGHAWVIVKVKGKWYYCDPTWDAGKKKWKYFLRGSKDFKKHKVQSGTKGHKIAKKKYK